MIRLIAIGQLHWARAVRVGVSRAELEYGADGRGEADSAGGSEGG